MFRVLPSYGNFAIHVLFFEIIYFFLGYKQSSVDILKNKEQNDNIPCPYFFLYKIKKFFLKEKINSLIDLGCGGGRALYFFKRYKKINYCGLENNYNVIATTTNLNGKKNSKNLKWVKWCFPNIKTIIPTTIIMSVTNHYIS